MHRHNFPPVSDFTTSTLNCHIQICIFLHHAASSRHHRLRFGTQRPPSDNLQKKSRCDDTTMKIFTLAAQSFQIFDIAINFGTRRGLIFRRANVSASQTVPSQMPPNQLDDVLCAIPVRARWRRWRCDSWRCECVIPHEILANLLSNQIRSKSEHIQVFEVCLIRWKRQIYNVYQAHSVLALIKVN